MRSIRVVTASDCLCQSRNSPGFDPSILRHSRIRAAADEALLNKVHKIKIRRSLPVRYEQRIGRSKLNLHLGRYKFTKQMQSIESFRCHPLKNHDSRYNLNKCKYLFTIGQNLKMCGTKITDTDQQKNRKIKEAARSPSIN